jgi:hypothetical protein
MIWLRIGYGAHAPKLCLAPVRIGRVLIISPHIALRLQFHAHIVSKVPRRPSPEENRAAPRLASSRRGLSPPRASKRRASSRVVSH